MTEQEALEQQLSGVFYAYDLLLNFLMKDYVARNADTGEDTEHLEAMFRDVRNAFDSNRAAMSDLAEKEARRKVEALIAMSLQKYEDFGKGLDSL